MYLIKRLSIFFMLTSLHFFANAQIADTAIARKLYYEKDSVNRPAEKNPVFKETDTTKLKNPKERNPRTAAIRSAILPGLGQAYNKRYWKIPIVYAALGGTAWYFFDNLSWYRDLRLGYRVAYNIAKNNDSTGYNNIKRADIRFFVDQNRQSDLKSLRDQTKNDISYTAVYFVLAWLLNVVDATVDAHLSTFDVNPNLTMQIKPGYSDMAKTKGLSLVLNIK